MYKLSMSLGGSLYVEIFFFKSEESDSSKIRKNNQNEYWKRRVKCLFKDG